MAEGMNLPEQSASLSIQKPPDSSASLPRSVQMDGMSFDIVPLGSSLVNPTRPRLQPIDPPELPRTVSVPSLPEEATSGAQMSWDDGMPLPTSMCLSDASDPIVKEPNHLTQHVPVGEKQSYLEMNVIVAHRVILWLASIPDSYTAFHCESDHDMLSAFGMESEDEHANTDYVLNRGHNDPCNDYARSIPIRFTLGYKAGPAIKHLYSTSPALASSPTLGAVHHVEPVSAWSDTTESAGELDSSSSSVSGRFDEVRTPVSLREDCSMGFPCK